jgi:hypothetical protein
MTGGLVGAQSTEITVVSGLPRSGTSMMMRMLEAGGLSVLTDSERAPDADNPRGYYELEKAKRLERDQAWLPEAAGKVVKIISALLRHLPPEYRYRVVFMQRDMTELLASQRQMLARRGEPVADDDAKMTLLFERHLREVGAWLARQRNMRALYVSYNDVVRDPRAQAEIINRFLGDALDVPAMVAAVEQELYRNRA